CGARRSAGHDPLRRRRRSCALLYRRGARIGKQSEFQFASARSRRVSATAFAMTGFLNPSFNRRPTFLAPLLVLLLGLVVGFLNEIALSAQKLRELDIHARTLAQSVAAPLMFADPSAARENANALAENPEVEAVGVYDARGLLIAEFRR